MLGFSLILASSGGFKGVIDWLSLSCPCDPLLWSSEDLQKLLDVNDIVQRTSNDGSEIRWRSHAWLGLRSDTQGLSFKCGGSTVQIGGSPARVLGDGCNVFSCGPSAAQDVEGCAIRMISYLEQYFQVKAPALEHWNLSRIDITRNLALADLAEVRQYLAYLKNATGGRIRVNAKNGDTVNYSPTSRHKRAIAYAKGPQLIEQMRAKNPIKVYTPEEIELANCLLRFEVRLFAKSWKQSGLNWRQLSSEILDGYWSAQFDHLLGHEIMSDGDLKQRCLAVAKTRGQGLAAYNFWSVIQVKGLDGAREDSTRPTFYRHIKVLSDAGLKLADFGNGQLIPFKVVKLTVANQVNSWSELREFKRAA